jgi:hypothetical protein
MYDDGAMSSGEAPQSPSGSAQKMVDIVESRPQRAEPKEIVVGMSPDGGVSVPVPRRSGQGGTFKNLAISMGVLVVPLIFLVWLFTPHVTNKTEPVDAAKVYQAAVDEKAFHVREPQGHSEWKPTVAVFNPATGGRFTVRVSYTTSKDHYLQLVQSNAPADSLIASIIDAGTPLGVEQVNGETWTRYSARNGAENAFVLLENDVTVVVVGDASVATARTMISSLR